MSVLELFAIDEEREISRDGTMGLLALTSLSKIRSDFQRNFKVIELRLRKDCEWFIERKQMASDNNPRMPWPAISQRQVHPKNRDGLRISRPVSAFRGGKCSPTYPSSPNGFWSWVGKFWACSACKFQKIAAYRYWAPIHPLRGRMPNATWHRCSPRITLTYSSSKIAHKS